MLMLNYLCIQINTNDWNIYENNSLFFYLKANFVKKNFSQEGRRVKRIFSCLKYCTVVHALANKKNSLNRTTVQQNVML